MRLSEFIRSQREVIIARTRDKVAVREAPRATALELEHGVPLFLDQLAERLEGGGTGTIGASASERGGELLQSGLTIGQVVHDYGNICQAITEMAGELDSPISTEDFRTLNMCLDVAIAESVTEYSRRREQEIFGRGVEQLGSLAHELRNYLNSATLAYEAIRVGSVGGAGSTGALLGRSLAGMRDLVTRSLAQARLEGGAPKIARLDVGVLLEEIEIGASAHAQSRQVRLTIEPVDPALTVDADYQLLTSILTNLVQNACKFTHPGGHVIVRTRVTPNQVSFEVEDECGGLTGDPKELFGAFEQRGADRSGLGLGLSISLAGARAIGGQLSAANLPGTGCIFTLDLPRPA